VWSNDVVIYCVQGVLTMELWNTMGMVAWMVSEDMEAGDEVVDETMAIVGVEGGMVVGICNRTLMVIITIGMTMWEGCLLHMAVVSFLKFYFIMFFIFYFESI